MKPYLGAWHIGRVNYVLAGVQILIWLQTGSRGLDYVQRRPPLPTPRALLVIESTLPLQVWGAGFLIAAGILFVGVTGRWWPVVVAGHVAGAVMYGCFTAGSWIQVPMFSVWLTIVGGVVLSGGVYLAVVTTRHDWARFGASIVLTGIGGWAAGIGMGYDFRTTTGFLVITLVHCLYAVGITWVATQRARTQATR